jgi:hypothetical protein
MFSSPVEIYEGLFIEDPSRGLGVQIPKEPGVVFLDDPLTDILGKRVSVSICYTPSNPPKKEPGFGCCFQPGSCQIHIENPEFLYSFAGEGVLSKDHKGNFSLGGLPLGLGFLNSHYGRIVLLQSPPPQKEPLEDLLGELESISRLLSSLKKEINK